RYKAHSGVRARALQALEAAAAARGATSGPALAGGGESGAGITIPVGQVDTSPSPVTGASGDPAAGPTTGSAPTDPSDSGGGSGSTGGDAGGAPPSNAPPPTHVSVVVITPLLSTLQFGASTGFLLACNTAAGSVSAAVAQVPGLSQVLTPVLSQISPLCGQLSAAAVSGLQTMNTRLAVLAPLTPATAPYFAALNQVFAAADAVAPYLQPFSGTITSLGPLVQFFSGSPPPGGP
ncbi:MAG: hypothetical protein QOE58_3405, partial [Actinomycetota bacterium]|nr:hypothetical protein [Actinomycetota bacterium]